MTVVFELDGHEFIALNGGPHFKFTEAISFSVDCKTQKEVDEFWEKLSEGGEQRGTVSQTEALARSAVASSHTTTANRHPANTSLAAAQVVRLSMIILYVILGYIGCH